MAEKSPSSPSPEPQTESEKILKARLLERRKRKEDDQTKLEKDVTDDENRSRSQSTSRRRRSRSRSAGSRSRSGKASSHHRDRRRSPSPASSSAPRGRGSVHYRAAAPSRSDDRDRDRYRDRSYDEPRSARGGGYDYNYNYRDSYGRGPPPSQRERERYSSNRDNNNGNSSRYSSYNYADNDRYGGYDDPHSYISHSRGRARSRSRSRERGHSSRSNRNGHRESSSSSHHRRESRRDNNRTAAGSSSRRDHRERSRSQHSNSRSRSRSVSREKEKEKDDQKSRNNESPSPSRGKNRASRSRSVSSTRLDNSDPGAKEEEMISKIKKTPEEMKLDRERRTVFISQLVMRTTERDLQKYFKRELRIQVNDVIFLKDRRQHGHRGLAYVELANLKDVELAISESGKVPDFQRFPIQIRRSEADKNYEGGSTMTSNTNTFDLISGGAISVDTNGTANNNPVQQVYIGNIERIVTHAQLHYLFSQFGPLTKVAIQIDPTTQLSRGFAFLTYGDAKSANLAIQTMQGQMLAGRALKTNWATVSQQGAEMTSDFPDDAQQRIANANTALQQLTGTGITAFASLAQMTGVSSTQLVVPSAQNISNVAQAALDAALGTAENEPTVGAPESANLVNGDANSANMDVVHQEDANDPSQVTGTPCPYLLVRNMYDKDTETDPNWHEDIREEFLEESAKFGTIISIQVVHEKPGGMVYVQFETADMASSCANALAGRWFDGRQLCVEFVGEEGYPDDVFVVGASDGD